MRREIIWVSQKKATLKNGWETLYVILSNCFIFLPLFTFETTILTTIHVESN